MSIDSLKTRGCRPRLSPGGGGFFLRGFGAIAARPAISFPPLSVGVRERGHVQCTRIETPCAKEQVGRLRGAIRPPRRLSRPVRPLAHAMNSERCGLAGTANLR